MATFYVLPPRACLDDALAAFLGKFLPGLTVPADAWDRLAEPLARPGVYLVSRDELPDATPLPMALADGFGAEPGDRVVEVSLGGASRGWVLTAGVSGAAAA